MKYSLYYKNHIVKYGSTRNKILRSFEKATKGL